MIQPRHPETTTVALLIAAERAPGGLEESAHIVLARYFADWHDERKADLYARLAESLHAHDTIAAMEVKVNRALWDNQNECLHV